MQEARGRRKKRSENHSSEEQQRSDMPDNLSGVARRL